MKTTTTMMAEKEMILNLGLQKRISQMQTIRLRNSSFSCSLIVRALCFLFNLVDQLLVQFRPLGGVFTHQEGTRGSVQRRITQRRFAFHILEVSNLFETLLISQALNVLVFANTAC
jgi:hypothetical protein